MHLINLKQYFVKSKNEMMKIEKKIFNFYYRHFLAKKRFQKHVFSGRHTDDQSLFQVAFLQTQKDQFPNDLPL